MKNIALITGILVLTVAAAAQPRYDLLLKGGHVIDPRNGINRLQDVAIKDGSSGWRNFSDFKDRIIEGSETRVLAMLNIDGRGMGGGEIEQNEDDMDAQATANAVKKYPETIVGIKTAYFRAPRWTAVDQAVRAGNLADVPVMVDFGDFTAERPFEELVTQRLRPGDMYTHMYLDRVPMFDEKGKLRPYLLEARKRGVKFDVGHGGGSFSWGQAAPAIRQGWIPDSISTDLHITSMNDGMKNMLNVMSKILNQGISLYDVIEMSTAHPAAQIKREDLGHLSVGAAADISVIRLDHGRFGFLDTDNARAMGTKRLECELTLRDGEVVWDLNGRAGQDWRTYYNKL